MTTLDNDLPDDTEATGVTNPDDRATGDDVADETGQAEADQVEAEEVDEVDEVDDDEVEKAQVDDSTAPGETSAPPRWAQWGILIAAVAVLVTGVLSWQGAGSEEQERAEHRDRALIEGRRLVETMQTMDPADLDEHLDRWRDATTGVLHDQLENIDGTDREMLADLEKRSTARVVDAAMTRLGDDTAVMLAAVEVTVDDADPDAEPVVKRNRFAADLVMRDGSWKLENLQQVSVNVS